jgi:hypothetical protein
MSRPDLFPWHQLPWDLSTSDYPNSVLDNSVVGHEQSLNLSKKHQLLAEELWGDIQAGKVEVYDKSGLPIRKGFRNLPSRGSETPHITQDSGNQWLRARGYLEHWQPETPVAVNTADKKLKRARKDNLTPIVKRAQAICKDPSDTAEVWNELAKLAAQEIYPLYGIVQEGIQYKDHQDEAAVFTKNALRKRLERQQ